MVVSGAQVYRLKSQTCNLGSVEEGRTKKTSHLEAKQNAEGLETWVDHQVTESYSENQQSRSTKQFIAKKWRH